MEPSTLKILFIFVAFIEAAALGIVPVKSKSFKESPLVLGIANAFSGGVFLAIALMHIMPEQSKTWELMQWGIDNCESQKGGFTTPLPFPFLLLVGGYTIILIIDKVLFDTHAILGHDDNGGGESILRKSVASIMRQSQVDGGRNSSIAFENAIRESMGSIKRNDIFAAKMSMHKAQKEEYETNKNSDIVVLKGDEDYQEDQLSSRSAENSQDNHINKTGNTTPVRSISDVTHKKPEITVDRASSVTDELFVDSAQKTMMRKQSEVFIKKAPAKKPTCIENMTPFILLIGLGTHAIFEGLALGLTKDMKDVILFTAAICMHKGAAGMSLGISMAKTFPEDETFVTWMILLFAIFTPLGVVLGMILSNGSDMTELLFACLAGGSFLYISMSEVIVEEFAISSNRFIKLFFFMLGIACIASLVLLDTPEADEHCCQKFVDEDFVCKF